MGTRARRGGKIEYLKEGFILHWDEEVLTVEVIDYHATMLRLAWKDVRALATIASGDASAHASEKIAKPRAKRPPLPEV